MSLEGVSPITEETSGIDNNAFNEADLKESFFLSYVNERLLEVFEEALEEVEGITEEKILEWKVALTHLPEEQLNAFLAIPHELLQRRVNALAEKTKQMDLVQVLQKEAERSFEEGYRVAYHCSKENVLPEDEDNENSPWTIDGLEADHRDGDLGMAYYSFDLANLYRKKNPKYIYLVRADTGESSVHKKDNDGSWGRATKLDVITKVSLNEAMNDVQSRVEEFKKRNETHGIE